MTAERNQSRRELGMLILGVIVGGLFGIVGNIWASYFAEFYKSISPTQNPDWTFQLLVLTITITVFTAILTYWAHKLLK